VLRGVVRDLAQQAQDATSYYFQYGTSTNYGHQTTTAGSSRCGGSIHHTCAQQMCERHHRERPTWWRDYSGKRSQIAEEVIFTAGGW
jgi:hypothetical protein